MEKKELAHALHQRKFNCCQSVACAFAQEVGVDVPTLFRAAEGFGLGMGGMNATCGAVSAGVLLAGFKNSDSNLDNPGTKVDTYKLSREIVDKFIERNGSCICRELKGIDSGTPLRTCPGCIDDAVEIIQEALGL